MLNIDKVRIGLWIAYLVFPSGIGLSYWGKNVDVNMVIFILITLLSLNSLVNLRAKREDGIAALFFLSALLFSLSWLSSFQYLFYIYIIIFYFSSYFIARLFFSERSSIIYFVNNIALAYLLVGIIGFLNYYFDFLNFNLLRPEAEAYAHEYTRGEITANLELIAYKGFFAHTHWFAMDRFVWMSLSACFLWYANRAKEHSINRHVLMASIAFGSIEIIWSQVRMLSLISIIVFLCSLYAYKSKYIPFLAVFLLIITPLFNDHAYYFFSNIYSLAGIFFEDINGFSYVLETDKRYLALMAILENYEQIILAPLGPLFWNFSPHLLGTESEYFDDLHPLLKMVLEYGLASLVFFLLLIVSALRSSRSIYYLPLFFWLLLILSASISLGSPRFYFYMFFGIGALVGARSIFSNKSVGP